MIKILEEENKNKKQNSRIPLKSVNQNSAPNLSIDAIQKKSKD